MPLISAVPKPRLPEDTCLLMKVYIEHSEMRRTKLYFVNNEQLSTHNDIFLLLFEESSQ